MKWIAGLLAAAVVFLAVELGMGAWGFGQVKRVDPCTATTPSLGGGFDAALQRIVLDGLNGAACRLHTTREQLVESLGGGSSRWSDEQIQAGGSCRPRRGDRQGRDGGATYPASSLRCCAKPPSMPRSSFWSRTGRA